MVIVIRALNLTAVQAATNFAPAQSYVFKRGTTPQIGVQFVDETGTAVPYPAGAVVTLGFKAPNPANNNITAFDGPYTISGSTGADADDNGIYWLPVGFSGDALNTALGYNPPVINDDVLSVTLAGEVLVVSAGGIDKTQTFSCIVFHDINTGTEGAITGAAYLFPQIWNTITALNGAGDTGLDQQATAGLQAIGNMVAMTGVAGVNAGGLTVWQLQAAAGRVTAVGLQQPADFDADANDVIWVKVL